MMVGEGGGGGREDGVSPTRRSVPSTRVQLEVAFLDADETGPAPAGPVVLDERQRLTVLVVAAEADVRRYVRECLRERVDLRLLEAATVDAAVAVATSNALELLVVDEPECDVIVRLSRLRAIVIVDDVSQAKKTSRTQVQLLTRPFTAERLKAEVKKALG